MTYVIGILLGITCVAVLSRTVSRRRPTLRGLFALGLEVGLLSTFAVTSLVQDWYGLDRYIEMCRTHWASPKITVPVMIALLVVQFANVGWMYRRTRPTQATPQPPQVQASTIPTPAYAWNASVDPEDRSVVLVFDNQAGKRFSVSIPPKIAMDISEEVRRHATTAAGLREPKGGRQTAWARLDTDVLDETNVGAPRPKAPEWPGKA